MKDFKKLARDFGDKAMIALWQKGIKSGDDARLATKTYPDDSTQYRDIPYLDDGNKLHQLDVYVPNGYTGKLPVIIDIHGGGWYYGDKELNKLYCLYLARRGFVVFNMSYRYAPETRVKGMVQDVMAGLHYVGEHMKDYPCDTDRVFVTGDSGGAQLAALVPVLLESETLRSAYETVDADVKIRGVGLTSPVVSLTPKGALGFYFKLILGEDFKDTDAYAPYLDFGKAADLIDDYPPTIIFTSIMDVVAEGQAMETYKYLKGRGTKVVFDKQYDPKLQHVYQVTEPDSSFGQRAIKAMTDFYKSL